MKLICVKDVVMNDGSTSFKAGEEYEFTMHSSGKISRFSNNCLHKFMCYGPDAWTVYFKTEGVK